MMIHTPGASFQGMTAQEPPQALVESLRSDVNKLAGEIGERNVFNPKGLKAAGEFIQASLEQTATVQRQEYRVGDVTCANIEAIYPGSTRPEEVIVVGAHYDSVQGSPGADDNASGVAAMLALVRLMAGQQYTRTMRFVAFANEEPPYFQTEQMGSLVYARRLRSRQEKIVAMLSLETMGYYSNQPGSQQYPFPFNLFYPKTGHFIGFVANLPSRSLLHQVLALFRTTARLPSEGAAAPASIPGIGWSDHWSFWQAGYPAVMVTDTAPFRYPYYHTPQDTPDKLDYQRLARVVLGLESVLRTLANP